jgi:peroxiredoxin
MLTGAAHQRAMLAPQNARMIPSGMNPSQAHRLADRLTGLRLPSVVLSGYRGLPLDLCEFAHTFPLVVYLYPGGCWSPEDGEDTPLVDAVQHCAFRDHQPALEARKYRAIGISSQFLNAQRETALASGVSHTLLRDPELLLARELGLPTFSADGGCWYRRLMLVTSGAQVEKAFFPVSAAGRSAAQVIAWVTMQGLG